MRYLLDTHTAFWYFEGSPKLSEKAKTVIEDNENEVFISIVSAWEIAIKKSLDRKNTTLCSVAEFFDEIAASGFDLITLKPHHVRYVEGLPFHHRDPFDRQLIATAIAENMSFLTADENARKYNVNILW